MATKKTPANKTTTKKAKNEKATQDVVEKVEKVVELETVDSAKEETQAEEKQQETDAARPTTPETPDPSGDKPMVLLIPYLKSEAAGDELKYALRTWEENYAGPVDVVIVGDKEPWFSDKVKHIPHDGHLIDEDCGCDNPKKIRDPQADVAHKLITAIAARAVEGEFVLTNDDIFLLGPMDFAHLSFLRSNGTLDVGEGVPNGVYRQNALRTAKELTQRQLPIVSYATHTPVVMDAELLAETIKEYKATEQGILLSSAYFNHWYPNARGTVRVTGQRDCTILASVYRANPDPKVLQTALERRLFLNCNAKGWQGIKHIIEKAYPNKSRFEK